MNKQELTAMVAEILGQMGREPAVKASDYHPTAPQSTRPDSGYADGDFVPDVTCLLYTSPSPRDKRQSRMPSSA